MSEACTHDCSNCHADCSSRAPQHEPPHAKSHIKKVIGVVSGKGGVGKSMTSAMMAVSMRRKGYKVGVLDADITGPSIPKLFGVHGPAMGTEDGINPVESHTGIKIMSINLLLEDEEAPVVWRGPVIAGAVKQFWQEVIWDDVDFLFVDMPPGTGDVPLTVFQTLPVDGIIIVSSPQELVGMIVGKAVQMAEMMKVPILGIVVRKQRLHLRCDLLGRRGFLSPDLIGKFLILPDAEPRAATVGGARLENAVQLLDECFGQASGSSLVDYQVNAAEVVRSLDHIINVDRLIRNAQRIGLENMTSLLLREPAALDMVGVVGQLDLNTVVDAAPELHVLLLFQDVEQRIVAVGFLLAAPRAHGILRDIPRLAR